MNLKDPRTINKIGVILILFGIITSIELFFVYTLQGEMIPILEAGIVGFVLGSGLVICSVFMITKTLKKKEAYI